MSTNLQHSKVMPTNQHLKCQNFPENDAKTFSFKFKNDDRIKFQDKFIFTPAKETKKVVKKCKEIYKVLHYFVDFSFDEVFDVICELDNKLYSKLFIFIVDVNNFRFDEESSKVVKKLQQKLLKFDNIRPLILQLTSISEKTTKIYFRNENSKDFNEFDDKENNEFVSFMIFLMTQNSDTFEHELISKLSEFQYSSLTLRLIRTLNLNDDFFAWMILNISKKGTKSEFFSALDIPFGDNGRTLSADSQNYLEILFETEDEVELNSTTRFSFQESSQRKSLISIGSDANKTPLILETNVSETSILLTALEHKNTEVMDYLVMYWTHLIQQLPFDHKVKISTVAFLSNQLDILCDLLQIADFPFPENITVNLAENHQNLSNIIQRRLELKKYIEKENLTAIDEFIDNNLNLKIAYIPSNISAMKHAIDSKKYLIYFHFKSTGFSAPEVESLEDILTEEELSQAKKHAAYQRKKNVNRALSDSHRSVHMLYSRSFIHNRKINKDQETEFRNKIKSWYEDISMIKFGIEFLDVAASCEDLKIIFDFESDTVENASLAGRNSLGSTYSASKWIFVGAKLTDKKREQKIKGVLAHELCHYVMRLIYENEEKPYYKHMLEHAKIFEEIVKTVDKWSKSKDSDEPNDECNGIISSVFTGYESKDFHPELIVRIIQILVEFDDDEETKNHLENKYKEIFDFWYFLVIPEMKGFNIKQRKNFRKLNENFGILSNIDAEKIKFTSSRDIKKIFDNKCTAVFTNVVELLMANISEHLKSEYGNQYDTQNVFVDPIKLKNPKISNNFSELVKLNQKLNILVDCSKGVESNFHKFDVNQESMLVFIIPKELQNGFLKIMQIKNENIHSMEIIYTWSNLTEHTQQVLLKSKVNFQNSSQFTLADLFKPRINTKKSQIFDEQQKAIINDTIDDQILKMLIANSKILINTKTECDKNFDLLFQQRKVWKKNSNCKASCSFRDQTENELKYNKYVLISDMAGNGKSWAMKNYEKIWRIKSPLKWTTYVDLKQYIDEFKNDSAAPRGTNLEFSSFFSENILRPETKFEGKIFQNFYKNDNVCILFDGFDEIAPDCAEFVTNMILSFESNGGNQLWIATRDYFEIDLQQKMQLKTIYKLNKFLLEDGINLIASIWILNDLKDSSSIKSRNEFEIFKTNSQSFKDYKMLASKIIEKVSMTNQESIGLPQFYKIIADIFKDKKEAAFDLTRSKIYEKFAHSFYKRWSEEKGEIRNQASIESQSMEMNFWRFHQYQAVASLCPELAKFLFPGYDDSQWKKEEIIACGLITKKSGKYIFSHETFREYFVADFVVKELKKLKLIEKPSKLDNLMNLLKLKSVENYVVDMFAKILTHRKFGVIQMFINDAIDASDLDNVLPKMVKYIEQFYKMDSFRDLFNKNLDKLINFVIAILKTGKYQNVKKILKQNLENIIFNTEDIKIFAKFQDFLFDFLHDKDLKSLIRKHNIFNLIIQSSFLEIEALDNFVTKSKIRLGIDIVMKGMKMMRVKNIQDKIFISLARPTSFDLFRLHKNLELMQKFLKINEIIEMLEMRQKEGENIIHTYIRRQDVDFLIVFWREMENVFKTQNVMEIFKNFVMDKDCYSKNILCWAAESENLEFHQALWDLLLKTFENRKELKCFILQESYGYNFVHNILAKNKNLAIFELALNVISTKFDNSDFKEIFESTNKHDMNVLQALTYSTINLEIHQTLWKLLSDLYLYDSEFLAILKNINKNGLNVFHIAATYSSNEIFEFMIQELTTIASTYEISIILSQHGNYNQNLLQSAVLNKSLALQSTVWKIFRKFFEPFEMLRFIEHQDDKGENLMFNACYTYSIEIIDLTWNEIKSFMNPVKQFEYLKASDGHGISLTQWVSRNRSDHEDLYNWLWNVLREYEIYGNLDNK